jgi:peptidoglycan/xylan/chitin deacetylase (PgdA/CDA1 family)
MKITKFLLILLAAAMALIPLPTQAKKKNPLAGVEVQAAAKALETEFPFWNGMVTFAFDDGHRGIYENALPIFLKYGVVATLSPVVGAIENGEDWMVTWQQLQEFDEAGWEIGSHTMTHSDLTKLADKDLDYELSMSKKLLADYDLTAKTVVFPYSSFDARVLDYATRYYENSRGFTSKELNGIDCDRYAVLSREVTAATQPDEVISWIKEAMETQKWLVLLLHDVVTGTPKDYQYNAGDLEKIVAFVADNNILAPTIDQAMDLRQAALGPNLIKNPKLENVDKSGWALNWTRNNADQVLVAKGSVRRLFSTKNRLIITGGSSQNAASPALIKLKDNKRPYLLSFFAEVATEGINGGIGVCVDEFDAAGNWLNYQWLGGFYWHNFGLPAFIYQPSSPAVAQVMIIINADAKAKVDFRGDNFFFGILKK